jgi:hypothetical protein
MRGRDSPSPRPARRDGDNEVFGETTMRLQGALLCGLFFVGIVACSGSVSRSGIEDTPENRREAAQRYLKVAPLDDLMRDGAEKVAQTLPEDSREKFKAYMMQALDVKRLESVMTDSMVNRFTVGEINALADFYGSPEGKSVMKKFGLYMADIMPALQAETVKAIAKAKQSSQ